MKVKNYSETIDIPEGVQVKLEGTLLVATKEKATVSRDFNDPRITLNLQEGKITLGCALVTRREKMIIGTYRAHIKNILKGVQEPYVYKLKVCSGHFPMNITVSGNKFNVKNFVGEKIPRVYTIEEGVDVKLDGDVVTVTSHDKEKAGRVAGGIEKLCKRPGFDVRIFQQGIFITEKAGKAI